MDAYLYFDDDGDNAPCIPYVGASQMEIVFEDLYVQLWVAAMYVTFRSTTLLKKIGKVLGLQNRMLRVASITGMAFFCLPSHSQCLSSARPEPTIWQNVTEYLRAKSTGPETYKEDRIKQLASDISEYANNKYRLIRLLDDHLRRNAASATPVVDAELKIQLPMVIGALGELSQRIKLFARNADLGGLTPILAKLEGGIDYKRAISLCEASHELGSSSEDLVRVRQALESMKAELFDIVYSRDTLLEYFSKK